MSMNKKFLTLILLFILVTTPISCSSGGGSSSSGQGTEAPFGKTFGGSGYDSGCSVQQTSDGGYILFGYTYSSITGTSDMYLVKTDSTKTIVWEKNFGGTENDSGFSVQQTTDGGYILLGETYSPDTDSNDMYLVKTDSTGTTEWEKTFGGTDTEWGNSVCQTTDGGYILFGTTEYDYNNDGSADMYLVKTDSSGTKVWEKTFGGTGYDSGFSVEQTTDGGYIMLGYTYSYGTGGTDMYLVKTDANGNETWSKTFGGYGYDEGFSVAQTADGGYILLGEIDSYDAAGGGDMYLVKTDADGNETWSKNFGGDNYEWGFSVQQTTDGGYILLGTVAYYDSVTGSSDSYDMYIVKADADGNETWSKTFGGSENECGVSVQQTTDGGYILLGDTFSYGEGSSDMYLVKTDADGNIAP